jgi:hypothetical protein
MPNFNDAQITNLYVSEQGSSAVQNDAPNAPAGGQFNLTLEMVAGTGLQSEDYTVVISCCDVTATTAVPSTSSLIPGAPLNGAGSFGTGPGWTPNGPEWFVFNYSVLVGPEPAADQGSVYQYTAALFSKNGQVVSLRQSDLFILV